MLNILICTENLGHIYLLSMVFVIGKRGKEVFMLLYIFYLEKFYLIGAAGQSGQGPGTLAGATGQSGR